MKDFTTEQLEAQKEAGIYGLFENNSDTFLIEESKLINAMKCACIDYYGAIDQFDQDALLEEYGIHFLPARNDGENMWRGTRY